MFEQPTEVDRLTQVFGTDVAHLMPAYADIPKEFKNGRTKWNKFQQDWFYQGITTSGLVPKAGIDLKVAIGHLNSINGSFEPKHEHKEAAVAYLASLWFSDESTWTKATA